MTPERAEIAVISGRGKTGRAVISALHNRGMGARPVGRRELADPTSALNGCAAVYVIAPNMAETEPDFVTDILASAHANGISRIIYHSVAAPYAPSMPHHLGKARAEDIVRRSHTDWTILQPCAYMQNFVTGMHAGRIDVAYDPDAKFGQVDLVDVADAAAAVLSDDCHIGATYELGGPELVSVRDIARSAENVVGRPITVHRVDATDWAAGPGLHLSAREREWLLAMFDYYDKYGFPAGGTQLASILGRRARDITAVVHRELD